LIDVSSETGQSYITWSYKENHGSGAEKLLNLTNAILCFYTTRKSQNGRNHVKARKLNMISSILAVCTFLTGVDKSYCWFAFYARVLWKLAFLENQLSLLIPLAVAGVSVIFVK